MSSLTLHSLDRARIRLRLGEARTRDTTPPEDPRERASLILDGLAEIEGPNGFESGAKAFHFVVQQGPGRAPAGVTARLSLQALRFAQALESGDARLLTRKLYAFNACPASSGRLRTLAGRARFRQLLDPDSDPFPLKPGWSRETDRSGKGGWMVWRRGTGPGVPRPSGATFKLYVSPVPERLPEVVEASLPILAEAGAWAFKTGSSVSQALRPDKLVSYFLRLEDVSAAARVLESTLVGIPAHGVPFSVGLDPGGLLSWGMDAGAPAGSARGHRKSWRAWITGELGRFMARMEPDQNDPEPWEFALARLALLGIDDETFAPTPSWQAVHSA